MKIIYAGTPDFALPPLQALVNSAHEVVAVLTQPDRPAGRGRTLTASPVKQFAVQHDITVLQPSSLKPESNQQMLQELQADVMVVVGYGLLLPQAVLDIPRLGCLNIHPSLLPRYRGPTPVQAALLNGDLETGVTIMQLELAMDAGPILSQQKVAVESLETAGELYHRLFTLGGELLLDVLSSLEQGSANALKQDDQQATYCKKFSKQDAALDWQDEASAIVNKVRALNPTPVAHLTYRGKPLRIWLAELVEDAHQEAPGTILHCDKKQLVIAAGQHAVRLLQVQLPGKKPCGIADFINGQKAHLTEGSQFA